MLAARPAKRHSVSDSDVIVAGSAFYTASRARQYLHAIAYFATIGQSFDWREPIRPPGKVEGKEFP